MKTAQRCSFWWDDASIGPSPATVACVAVYSKDNKVVEWDNCKTEDEIVTRTKVARSWGLPVGVFRRPKSNRTTYAYLIDGRLVSKAEYQRARNEGWARDPGRR